jgi:mannose-6-phosphate isomerase-like protein (cupin superfamily)
MPTHHAPVACFWTLLAVTAATALPAGSASAQDASGVHATRPHSATTAGLSADELARLPHVLFAHELEDVPDRNIVVSLLDYPIAPGKPAHAAPTCEAHRHAGPAYVYVLKGTMRLGIGGQPVQVLHAGQSFYEPAGALHTVAENASATEPAAALAVLILPRGAPILTPEKCAQP